jgi:hypothetical protein
MGFMLCALLQVRIMAARVRTKQALYEISFNIRKQSNIGETMQMIFLDCATCLHSQQAKLLNFIGSKPPLSGNTGRHVQRSYF